VTRHPDDAFRDSELTAEEKKWVRDIPGSILLDQAREKPHLHANRTDDADGARGDR